MMNSGSLFDARIVALARKFVCVRIDTDRTPEIHQRYQVRDLPTIVFLTRTGVAITRYVNADRNPPAKVLARMQQALDGEARVLAEERELTRRAAAAPQRGAPWKALADFYARRHGSRAAITAYRRSYALEDSVETIAALAVFCLRDRNFEEALAACEQGLRKYGETPDAARLLYYQGLGRVHGGGDRVGARAAWQSLVKRFPHSPWAGRARKLMVRYAPGARK